MQNFARQEGYGAFTVSLSNLADTIAYIKNQKEHHRHKSFQEEYLAFLKKHEVAYNEKYIWTDWSNQASRWDASFSHGLTRR